MWFFNRKPKNTTEAPAMPPELNDYYQAEKRQQTAVTWLLGFATLAITIALAFALFLGVRWVIKKARNQPATPPATTQNETTGEEQGVTQTPAPAPSGDSPETPGSLPSGETQGNQTNQAPQTSSARTNMPSTGPTETIAVFALATAAGTVLYKVTRYRSQY